MQRRRMFRWGGSALGMAVLSACGQSRISAATGFSLAVAASLNDVMRALDAAFIQPKPRPAAVLQAAGSGALAQQIVDGARFDLFAAADRTAMEKIIAAKIVSAADVVVMRTLMWWSWHTPIVTLYNSAILPRQAPESFWPIVRCQPGDMRRRHLQI